MKCQSLSVYLISAGTCLNITGAVFNCVGIHEAFAIWIFSNFICALYFFGAWRNWWTIKAVGNGAMMYTYCPNCGSCLVDDRCPNCTTFAIGEDELPEENKRWFSSKEEMVRSLK